MKQWGSISSKQGVSCIVVSLSLLVSAFSVFARQDEKTIITEGMAAGGSLQSRDAALTRALRNAIEEGVGTLIDSETMVNNFQLLDDRVYSEVKGYVKSYEVLEDNKGEGGVYRLKVKACVALVRLLSDIQALGLIKEKKGNPRLMFLFAESIDGVEQPRVVAQAEVERAFLKRDFPLVDKAQMDMVKSRDATLSWEDPNKAAALGRRFGAEVVVVGQATGDLMDTSRPYGVSVFAYEGRVQAKAIKVDTASLIASESVSAVERGSGRVPTANKALQAAGQKLAMVLMKDIVEKWRSEVYNLTTIQLIIENATFKRNMQLKSGLKTLRSIKSVNERSFTKGILILDIEMFGTPDQLAILLTESEDFNVEVTGKTQNRIDLRFN